MKFLGRKHFVPWMEPAETPSMARMWARVPPPPRAEKHRNKENHCGLWLSPTGISTEVVPWVSIINLPGDLRLLLDLGRRSDKLGFLGVELVVSETKPLRQSWGELLIHWRKEFIVHWGVLYPLPFLALSCPFLPAGALWAVSSMLSQTGLSSVFLPLGACARFLAPWAKSVVVGDESTSFQCSEENSPTVCRQLQRRLQETSQQRTPGTSGSAYSLLPPPSWPTAPLPSWHTVPSSLPTHSPHETRPWGRGAGSIDTVFTVAQMWGPEFTSPASCQKPSA